MSEASSEKKILGLEARNVKWGIYGFIPLLLVCLLALKPHLPKALYYNFANIDDYHIFSNRVVRKSPNPQPWKVAAQSISGPSDDLNAYLKKFGTTALLVVDNGEISFEHYDQPAGGPSGPDEISGSFSVAKSIVGLLTGAALDSGAIRSLDEPVGTYVTEWGERPEGKIRIRDLLQMTAGLNWNEAYSNPFSITTEAYYGNDLRSTIFRMRLDGEPGTQFLYGSGITQLLGLVVSRAVNKSLAQYASEKLWAPLGAEHEALWSLDRENGMEKAYCCFNATARDFARIGQLVLQQGKWQGQQLISKEYIQQMTTGHGVLDRFGQPTDYYGFQWWVYKTPKGNIVPYARGILGQYVGVLPHRNRVFVRLGMKRDDNQDHHPVDFRKLVEWLE